MGAVAGQYDGQAMLGTQSVGYPAYLLIVAFGVTMIFLAALTLYGIEYDMVE